MTAAPLSPESHARQAQRPHAASVRGVLAVFVVLQALLLPGLAPPSAAARTPRARQRRRSRSAPTTALSRLAFRFDQEVRRPSDDRLSDHGRHSSPSRSRSSVDKLNAAAPDLISAARLDPDGTAIRIALSAEGEGQHDPGGRAAVRRSAAGELVGPAAGPAAGRGRRTSRAARRTAERQLHRQKSERQGAQAADHPRAGRQPADLHALRVRRARRRQCRARPARRQIRAQLRPADQMGSGRRGGVACRRR